MISAKIATLACIEKQYSDIGILNTKIVLIIFDAINKYV